MCFRTKDDVLFHQQGCTQLYQCKELEQQFSNRVSRHICVSRVFFWCVAKNFWDIIFRKNNANLSFKHKNHGILSQKCVAKIILWKMCRQPKKLENHWIRSYAQLLYCTLYAVKISLNLLAQKFPVECWWNQPQSNICNNYATTLSTDLFSLGTQFSFPAVMGSPIFVFLSQFHQHFWPIPIIGKNAPK